MLAASFGEVAACLIRVPVEIVKQRRQAFSGVTRPCHALLGPLFTLTIFGKKMAFFSKTNVKIKFIYNLALGPWVNVMLTIFCDFPPILGKKIGVFSKKQNNVMIPVFAKNYVCNIILNEKTQIFFRTIFVRKYC
jgi:hypothetical protein